MRIDNSYLLPQMSATGTGAEGAQMLNKESDFQAQLKAATDKLDSKKINVMTDEEVKLILSETKYAGVVGKF